MWLPLEGENKIVIDSHVQMPKCVLKKFANQSCGFFCFDIESGRVKKCHPKTLNTEWGYYSSHVEKYLCDEIETKVGRLIKTIEKSDFTNPKELPCDYERVVRLYVYSLVSRSPSLQKEMKEKNTLFSILPEIMKHDIVAEGGIKLAEKANLLSEYKVAFLVNTSGEEMMLPTGGLMTIKNKICCPVSPIRAFVLEYKGQHDDLMSNTVNVYSVEDKKTIQDMNKRIIEQERSRDKKFVVSRNRESLVELLKEMNIPFAD